MRITDELTYHALLADRPDEFIIMRASGNGPIILLMHCRCFVQWRDGGSVGWEMFGALDRHGISVYVQPEPPVIKYELSNTVGRGHCSHCKRGA